MGNENDKRLEKKNIKEDNPCTHSQPTVTPTMNINQQQNERVNPYDKSKQQNQNQNQNNMRMPPMNPMNNNYNNNNNNNNNPQIHRALTQKRQNTITKKMLKDAFKTYSIHVTDGSYLNRPRFNDAIESIFRFNIPEMHYTHLCNKIYDLLDSSGDGKIQEDEFIDGFAKVLKDKYFRYLLSMMAMMTGDKSRDFIEIREIKEFFYLSYIEAFKHLGWQMKRNKDDIIKNNLPFATIQQLGKWAAKYKKEIDAAIDRDMRDFDPSVTNAITFDQFIRWISIDHNIYLQYGNKKIIIATSLTKLDDIYYDETIDSTGPIGTYPSI